MPSGRRDLECTLRLVLSDDAPKIVRALRGFAFNRPLRCNRCSPDAMFPLHVLDERRELLDRVHLTPIDQRRLLDIPCWTVDLSQPSFLCE